MREKKLLILLFMMLIIFVPNYRIKAEEIKPVKSNSSEINSTVNFNNSIKYLESNNTDSIGSKNIEDVKAKSLVLISLFIIVIGSKCTYTALKLRKIEKY